MATTPVTFDLSSITEFGTYGQESITKMRESLSSNSLSITFSNSTKKFTVLGSSSLSKQTIEKIFAGKEYKAWVPTVLEETDVQGNHLVKLHSVEVDSDHSHSGVIGYDSSRGGRAPLDRGAFELFTVFLRDYVKRDFVKQQREDAPTVDKK